MLEINISEFLIFQAFLLFLTFEHFLPRSTGLILGFIGMGRIP